MGSQWDRRSDEGQVLHLPDHADLFSVDDEPKRSNPVVGDDRRIYWLPIVTPSRQTERGIGSLSYSGARVVYRFCCDDLADFATVQSCAADESVRRLALSPEEMRTSEWVGLSLLGGVLLSLGFVAFGPVYLLFAALMCALMSFPLSRVYDCDKGWPRTAMVYYTLGLLGLFLTSTTLMILEERLVTGELKRFVSGLSLLSFLAFCGGIVIMQFVTPALVRATPRR